MIGYPTNDTKVHNNSHITVRGVAWDEGKGIRSVLISVDEGKTWQEAVLGKDIHGRYSFREFRFSFKPKKYGKQKIMSKAINKAGEEQPMAQDIKWNHGGYKYNGVDEVTVEVI